MPRLDVGRDIRADLNIYAVACNLPRASVTARQSFLPEGLE